ncbi:plexin-C1-like [Asterias rubens]|uniref:plexin-C1-like n=1 Tax=Asterias rubens TaxID=7604 RepID=UPI0014557CCA|nr:plexin-C1-like [Asterias rubens]
MAYGRSGVCRKSQKALCCPWYCPKYIDHMFESILNADQAPRAVKYLFDFFDSQSEMILQTLGHASMSEKETGDLAAAFWSAAICRPDFIFDIRPSCPVEASIEVTAQAFYDAHEASDQKLGKDSDLKKLLFKKYLENQSYAEGIYNMP